MKKSTTKEKILTEALNLFAVKGYQQTSMSQISNQVGIRKASLYSHFKSKQEILDTLIDIIINQYQKNSRILTFDKKELDTLTDKSEIISKIVEIIQNHFVYLISDDLLVKARKMLVIEQFRNDYLSKLYTKMSVENVDDYIRAVIDYLIEKGLVKEYDKTIMVEQFSYPISMYIALCDRGCGTVNDYLELIERHIRQYVEVYQ
ncbi:MAG: TetR/AcrR family transcriptional regulator [Erysipelotrichaceae bacterium]